MEKTFTIKDFQDFINTFFKRWKISLIIFAAIFSTVVVSVLNQDYQYEAKTKVIIGEGLGQKTLGSTFDSYRNYVYEQQEFATQPFIIRSKPIATQVAIKLNWFDADRDKDKFDLLVRQIQNAISIRRVEESRLFSINAVDTDAKKAQSIANTTADVFIEYNFEKKLNAFRKSISWLADQLIDLESKLEESQKELIGYIETERITSFDDQSVLPNPPLQTQEVDESRILLDRLRSRKVEQELEIGKLLQRYTDKHPKVIRAQEELALTQAKLNAEGKLMKSRDTDRESEAIRVKQKEIKYSILKRKVEINKELYNSLIQKMKEIDIASAINDNNMYVMEYAPIPPYPFRPNKSRAIFFGFFVSLIFAISIPFLIDYLDPTLHSAEEVESFLKLPVLSTVPIFAGENNGANQSQFPALHSHSLEAEAFRILRTNIRFAFPADSGKCLLITSSGPSEGKSTIAANLALTIASAGFQVCLVDTDLRLPRIHKMFNLQNEIGLTNYLVGDEPNLDKIIQPSGSQNLSIIPSGLHTPKPAEMLETERMKQTVKLLLSKFDRVIFDSPPAGNIIDASIIASHLDGVIFVLQAGRLNKSHVKSAKEQLDRVKANICGVVLNKVVLSKKSDYYYYYYNKPKDEAKPEADKKTVIPIIPRA